MFQDGKLQDRGVKGGGGKRALIYFKLIKPFIVRLCLFFKDFILSLNEMKEMVR